LALEDWTLSEGDKPSGGQGYIAKVEHSVTGLIGALKLQHESHRQVSERRFRMQREAFALIAMEGLGVPKLLETNAHKFGDKEINLFVVMEWIDGQTLSEKVERNPMIVDEALEMMSVLLDTLERSHRLEIYHRDLKPDNLMLRAGSTGDPILLDFGMSWAKPSSEAGFESPQGQEIGNRFFRLPEHMPGRNHSDPRSDIAMAVAILFYALFRKKPLSPEDEYGIAPHRRSNINIPSAVSEDPRWPRLKGVFDVGFQQEIELRFQSIEELRSALKSLMPNSTTGLDEELQDQLAKFKDHQISTGLAVAERHTQFLLDLNLCFDKDLRGLIRDAGLGVQGVVRRLADGVGSELGGRIVQVGGSGPSVAFDHQLLVDGAKVKASLQIEIDDRIEYYCGPLADESRLKQEVDIQYKALAAELMKRLAKILNI